MNTQKEVPFILGDEKRYFKIKIANMNNDMIEVIKKYEQNSLKSNDIHYKQQEGDIFLHSITYDDENYIQSIHSYKIPKSNYEELNQILEQIK